MPHDSSAARLGGFKKQQTKNLKSVHAPGGLFGPIEEPGRIRNTGNGWRASWAMWLEEHPQATAVGVAAAAGALALLSGTRKGR
jgi:hypothetical protein